MIENLGCDDSRLANTSAPKETTIAVSDKLTNKHLHLCQTPEFAPEELEAYRNTHFELIPLHGPRSLDARGRSLGKVPIGRWRELPPMDIEQAADHIGDGNVGVRLSNGDLVIDVDPRNFVVGDDPLRRLQVDLRVDFSGYPTVETGSGGLHIYMKIPSNELLLDTVAGYQGIEFKTFGRQVVAAGSAHPETGKAYRVKVGGFKDVPQAPEVLLGLTRRPERASAIGAGKFSDEWLALALEVLDPTDYRDHEAWLNLMMACHHATAGDGRHEFVEWSISDPLYASDAWLIGRRWDSLHTELPTGRQITYRTMLRELHRKGVAHLVPAEPDAERIAEDFDDNLDTVAVDDEEFMGPTEFIVDGLLPTGLGVIAGAWGSGKTVNLIPLLATAAHVTPKEWTVGHSELRRRVIILTEDVAQVKSSLYSLSKNAGAANLAEIREWVKFAPARRLSPKALAERVRKLGELNTYKNEHGYSIRPVVLLDTANANCELESENDSRAVGQMMSELKLTRVPTIIVGHVAKAITRSEFAAHSFRGSGAWEADADFTGYLLHERDTDMRYLGMHKLRFVPDYREVVFESFSGSVNVGVPWHPRKLQEKRYLNGVPIKSSTVERKALAVARQLEGREKGVDDAVTALLQEGEHPTVTAVKKRITGSSAALTKAIMVLCDEGRLNRYPVSHSLSEEKRKALGLDSKVCLLLPEGLALETYVERKLGNLPDDEFDDLNLDPLDEDAYS